MDGEAVALAVVLVLILVVIAAYSWWRFFGWQPFTYKSGDAVSWAAAADSSGVADVSRLRWRKAIFTITTSAGTYSRDVSATLNGMAAAHRGTANDGYLKLDANLNPFSFVISGVNSSDRVSDTTVEPWKSARATLVGFVRTI